MMTLKVKTKSGHITDMQVEELIEVDGKPFKTGDAYQELRDAVIHLEGRLATIEALFVKGSNDG